MKPRVFFPPPRVALSASLTYERKHGAEVCPDEDTLHLEVSGRMGHDVFKPDPEAIPVGSVRVVVSRVPRGFVAQYEWTRSLDGTRVTGRFEEPGSTRRDCYDALLDVATSLNTEFVILEIEYGRKLAPKEVAPTCHSAETATPAPCMDSRFSIWPIEWPLPPLDTSGADGPRTAAEGSSNVLSSLEATKGASTMHARTGWKIAAALCALGLAGAAANRALASGQGNDFSGTYLASLAERAEIMNLHRDGTATITLSDEVTSGAGGFSFSDSFGSWKQTGARKLSARFVNLNFDISGPPTFTGTAVVDYVLEFSPGLDTFAASCQGKIYPTGQDPFAPGAIPYVEFDCAYLTGNPYRRVPLP